MHGRGSGPSSGSWQAAVGAWVASHLRGAEGAALVACERVTDAVVEVQTWSGSTGLSRLHTSMYLDDSGFLLSSFSCSLVRSFFVRLAFVLLCVW